MSISASLSDSMRLRKLTAATYYALLTELSYTIDMIISQLVSDGAMNHL